MITKLPSHRNCKVCKTRFKPEKIYQWWCDEEHKEEYIKQLAQNAHQDALKKAEQRRREKEKKERIALKVRKINAKPKAYWTKQAQQAVNAFVRARDSNLPCVMCHPFSSTVGRRALQNNRSSTSIQIRPPTNTQTMFSLQSAQEREYRSVPRRAD